MAHATNEDELSGARYEYRVWGKHKKARKLLERMADDVQFQVIEDCYFLVDQPELNAKIRNDTLKVKRLVGRARGFERWVSQRHRQATTAPEPLDALFEDLRLDRAARGKSYDLSEEIANLDEETAASAVFVTKRRTRYRIGALRAEVTDITIDETGEVRRSLAIEGDDLDALVVLRKRLGLKGVENVAVHVAIDEER